MEASGGSSYIGVMVLAGESSSGSLSVDVGSLTASGRKGILFPIGSPSLNVNDSTIVRASGGIAAGINEDVTVPTEGTGIVFNGSTGTVYGNASLQKDLIIGEGESLILDNGANLDANGHNVIVDGGILDEGIKNSLGDSVKVYAHNYNHKPAKRHCRGSVQHNSFGRAYGSDHMERHQRFPAGRLEPGRKYRCDFRHTYGRRGKYVHCGSS